MLGKKKELEKRKDQDYVPVRIVWSYPTSVHSWLSGDQGEKMAVRHLPWPVNVGTPTKRAAQMTTTMPNLKLTRFKNWVTEFGSKSMKLALSSSLLLALSFNGRYWFISNRCFTCSKYVLSRRFWAYFN